ncbi:MAG TPA: serine/threonine-protein kinase, partial [Thermoanaerobaculia bacterium]|nr:serine/threonine-protein kinase [Thermoanaerobaculia bacterium]
MNDPLSGRTVGRYRIVGFLGSGAMGEVYLAEDPHIERKLAIKTVRLAGRPQEIEDRKKRLLREARAAGRLLHPNVVTLFDAGETEGQLYLAFEFVEGADLAGKLESGYRPSLREVLRIVRQTADALHYAHAQGIVHRDIKPSNILVDTTGRVKVADFGIAKMTGQSTELTVAGSVMGSPQYLSPEQIRGEDLDGRTDIFSLGVVLYELLSGKRPFDGDTITTLVYQILHKDPPPISELRTVPPQLEELLRRMLAKERDERIAPAGKVAEELAAIERDLSDETLSAPAVVAAEPLEQTYVLPRSTATPPVPGLPPPPPPPAAKAAVSLPTASAPSRAPQAAPPAPPPPPPYSGAAAPPQRKSPLWIPVALILALVAVLAAGAWLALRKPEPEPTQTLADTSLGTDAAPQTVPEE